LEILNELIQFTLFLMGKFNSKVEQIESRTASWNGLCSTFEGPLCVCVCVCVRVCVCVCVRARPNAVYWLHFLWTLQFLNGFLVTVVCHIWIFKWLGEPPDNCLLLWLYWVISYVHLKRVGLATGGCLTTPYFEQYYIMGNVPSQETKHGWHGWSSWPQFFFFFFFFLVVDIGH